MWPATVHSCWERFFVRCATTKQSISWATSPGCGSMTVPMAFRENQGTHKKLDLAKEKVGPPMRRLHTERKRERWGKRVWRQGRGRDNILKPKWWTLKVLLQVKEAKCKSTHYMTPLTCPSTRKFREIGRRLVVVRSSRGGEESRNQGALREGNKVSSKVIEML